MQTLLMPQHLQQVRQRLQFLAAFVLTLGLVLVQLRSKLWLNFHHLQAPLMSGIKQTFIAPWLEVTGLSSPVLQQSALLRGVTLKHL
jgi:hypothetical protein